MQKVPALLDEVHWRLASGIEVDFVIGHTRVAIEVKSSSRIGAQHLTGLEAIGEDHPKGRRLLMCLEPKRRVMKGGIEILPVTQFLQALWNDEIA